MRGLGFVPGEADVPGGAAEQRRLVARLRAVVEARDAENAAPRAELAGLRAELAAALDHGRRQELRAAELERRLGMDSSNSGTPTSKEPAGVHYRVPCLRRLTGRAAPALPPGRRRGRARVTPRPLACCGSWCRHSFR